jgi:Kae1-associated kinase Bud32
MLFLVRNLGIRTPFIYLVDPHRAEIVMEYVVGLNARDIIDKSICLQIGKYISILHNNSIIHGDLTPSNFIVGKEMVILDFGLSYHSNRVEDKAVDIRLFGEILNGLYPRTCQSLYDNFIEGYKTHSDNKDVTRVLRNVEEINLRRRYAVHHQ